jgi:hypothetical protein
MAVDETILLKQILGRVWKKGELINLAQNEIKLRALADCLSVSIKGRELCVYLFEY